MENYDSIRGNNDASHSDVSDGELSDVGLKTKSDKFYKSLRWAHLSLFVEDLLPRIYPFLVIILFFLIVSWFGIWSLIPDWLRLIGLAAFGFGFVCAFSPLFKIQRISKEQIIKRVERNSQTLHRPLTAQLDRLTKTAHNQTDSFASVLFEAHRERMQAELKNLRTGLPNAHMERFDSWGIRSIPMLLTVIAFGVAYGEHWHRIGDAFQRHTPFIETAGLRVDAWVTPPNYTGRAPIFLSEKHHLQTDGQIAQSAISQIPEGSRLLVQYSGTDKPASLSLKNGSGVRIIELTPGTSTSNASKPSLKDPDDQLILSDKTLAELYLDDQLVRSWKLDIIADTAPQIEFENLPASETNGTFAFSYRVEDDYGVTQANAKFALTTQANQLHSLYDTLEIDLPLPRRNARLASFKTSENLANHPWAGAQVSITLHAEDAAGNSHSSKPAVFKLPERHFSDALARAIISERRKLALDKRQSNRTADVLDALTTGPELFFEHKFGPYLALITASHRLRSAHTDDDLRNIVDFMWDIALGIEDGNLSLAADRLREAREQLSDAIENRADDEEIERLMSQLREAMQEFMQAMQENMQNQNPDQDFAFNENTQILRQQDLERMMDQIQDLAQSGARDAAQDMLNQLQQMMDNLQSAQNGPQQNQNNNQNNELNDATEQLADILQKQQQLRDQTFQQQQKLEDAHQQQRQADRQAERRGNPFGRSQERQSQGSQTPKQRTAKQTLEALEKQIERLQQQQSDVQQQLQDLMAALEDLGLESPSGFDEAENAMGSAGEKLGEGETGSAVGEQGRALEALRQGSQQMMQQLMDMLAGQQSSPGAGQGGQFGQQPGLESGQQNNRPGNRDPLGRERGSESSNFERGRLGVNEEEKLKRSREIRRQIIKRLEKKNTPVRDKDYLEKLLQAD